MSASAGAGQVCPLHPGVPAAAVCTRCGRFLCLDCAILRQVSWYCRDCARRVANLASGSWVAITAGISAFVGLGCPPLAALAIVLALSDLVMIASGRSSKGGLKLDLVAIALATAALVLGFFLLGRLGELATEGQ